MLTHMLFRYHYGCTVPVYFVLGHNWKMQSQQHLHRCGMCVYVCMCVCVYVWCLVIVVCVCVCVCPSVRVSVQMMCAHALVIDHMCNVVYVIVPAFIHMY